MLSQANIQRLDHKIPTPVAAGLDARGRRSQRWLTPEVTTRFLTRTVH